MRTLRRTAPLLVLLSAALPAAADGLPPAGRPIEQVVDLYVGAKLKEEGVTPAPTADDANLLRRLTLDLVGRIPTAAETRAYVASTDPSKKTKLVDRLLASPGYARHQANEFEAILMAGSRGSLRDYLLRAFREERTWDKIFRGLLLADETDAKQKGAAEFLKVRLNDLDRLTAEVSAVFFGVNVSCARCHDHPKVPDWKQDHFFGMKVFFSRTFDNGGFVAERDYGTVKFRTTAGKEKLAPAMFLTGTKAELPAAKEPSGEEQKKEKSLLEEYKKKRQPPPPPKVSARARLVELALRPGQQEFFARSIVNRVWHRLFGYGLVMPLDQMHSENPPSHPELLAWLARDVAAHGYDLRRLTRGLVLSAAYARSSQSAEGTPPKPSLFAVASVRPLTPAQLAMSLRLATTDPATLPPTLKPEDFERRIEGLENSARDFARFIEQPGEDFQIGVTEALLFSNGDRVEKEFLSDGGDRLLGRLKQLKAHREVIETAVRNVLSRPPRPEELEAFEGYLRRREARPIDAYRQFVWALLASAEFRFNY